jgi:hypothetical protein
VGCPQTDKNVYVVSYPANGQGDAVDLANDPADVSVQLITPRLADPRLTVPRAENDMTVETQMR